MLTEDQRRFLDSRRVGHLATADARAAPHVVPVCFAITDDTLYITIDQKPKGDPRTLKRLRNIIDNPAVAFVADRYDEDWTRLGWVMLRGPADILESGQGRESGRGREGEGWAEHGRAQALLRLRYPQYQQMQLDDLPVIAIRIERVANWGDLSVDP